MKIIQLGILTVIGVLYSISIDFLFISSLSSVLLKKRVVRPNDLENLLLSRPVSISTAGMLKSTSLSGARRSDRPP